MYAREGYISLAHLWRDFESSFWPLCKKRALECMEADQHSSNFVFGTALDLCEDVFLRSFDTFRLSLVPTEGEVVHVESVLPHSGARLLQKASAFESAQISMFPDEAGPDGMWLRQMGSPAFSACDFGWLRPDKKGRGTGKDLEMVLFANVFHTLPILFERPAFVFAKERPPWSDELLEEAYVRNVWPKTRGSSICLSDASFEMWNMSMTKRNVAKILKVLLSENPTEGVPDRRSIGGRPRKLPDVVRAYLELGLMNDNLTRKEELRRIEEHLKEKVSDTTLVRAKRKIIEMEAMENDSEN